MRPKKKKFKIPVIDLKKYRGKQVAIIDGKVVTSGKTTEEVLKKAQALYPKKEIWLFSVPHSEVFIYILLMK